jgi:putative hydrolase of the HAD superfamily
MFEDLARNLEVPAVLGMRTVLVLPSAGIRDVLDAWEVEGHDAPYIDYRTDDLGSFLGDVLAAIREGT